jgi:transcriptional regulator with XRE-family HTH domain
MISPAQIRAARQLANLSQAVIAKATGLSIPTIKRAESERDVSVSAEAFAAIRSALEAAGVEFIPENGKGPGVRLKKQSPRPARHD